MRRLFDRILCTLGLTLAMVALAQGQVAVIVHKSVPVNSASAQTILDYYRLATRTWKDGTPVTVVALKGNEEVVRKFHAFIGRTPLEMRKMWIRIQLSGDGRAPAALSSEAEAAQRVVSTPGAIGFVSLTSVPEGAKIIAVIE